MYRAAGHFVGAGARYRAIELNGKLDSANPHQLVAILFDELTKAMDLCMLAVSKKDFGQIADRQSRSLSILQALDSSLDFDKGGEVAVTLSTVYRESRRLISLGVREMNPDSIKQARGIIAEIASAWTVIS